MAKQLNNWSIWGLRGRLAGLEVTSIRQQDDESRIAAVCRSVARRTGLAVANCRLDSRSPDGTIYEVTLGKPLRSGGYAVEGGFWARV
jgi:hypothetical protein